jgi:hypothetical protein
MRRGIATFAANLTILVAIVTFGGGRSPLAPAVADEPEKSKAGKDGKADHPAAAVLRERVMREFHGRATDLFTTIPGFGYERLVPIYERIPWEVPHFSTDDIEVENAPATPKLLEEVFAKSLESYKNATRAAAPAPKPEAKSLGGALPPAKPGFGGTLSDTVLSGVQLRLLDLVGVLNPDHPKVYSGGKAFELIRSQRGLGAGFGGSPNFGPGASFEPKEAKVDGKKEAKKEDKGHYAGLENRPLDLFESTGLSELADGKETFVRAKGNVIRMLGALRASEQCLSCHTEHRKGDLLGALSYTFVDVQSSLKLDKKQ